MLPTLDKGSSLLPERRWCRPLPCRTNSPFKGGSVFDSDKSAEPRTSAECRFDDDCCAGAARSAVRLCLFC